MEQEAIVIGHEAVKNVRDVEQEGIFNPDAPEVIAKAHFSKESSENGLSFKDDRVVRKPRRPSSKSESAAEGGDAHGVRLHGTSKSVGAAAGQRRVRKSRHAGRLRQGEPKKGRFIVVLDKSKFVTVTVLESVGEGEGYGDKDWTWRVETSSGCGTKPKTNLHLGHGWVELISCQWQQSQELQTKLQKAQQIKIATALKEAATALN